MSGAAFVRVSFAAEEGRLREGLTRLADWVRVIQGTFLDVGRKVA